MIRFFRLLVQAYSAFERDDGVALAGYIAYSALLGFFPFLILAANLGTLFVGQGESDAMVEALFEFAPTHVAQTLESVLRDVLEGVSGGLLTVSALAALYFSSNAIEAIRLAFDRAYDGVERRRFVHRRLVAMACVLVGIAVAMVLGVTIVFGPLLIQLVEAWVGSPVPQATEVIRLCLGVLVFILYLMLLHRALPARSLPIRSLWPGVLLSTFIWLAAAGGFSFYLSQFNTYASTYGTLAGVVITLMFFYISGLAVIFGAEVNAVLNGMGDGE